MKFSESEESWIERRSQQLHEESGLALPMCRSEAMRQLVHDRQNSPSAKILKFRQTPELRICPDPEDVENRADEIQAETKFSPELCEVLALVFPSDSPSADTPPGGTPERED